MYRSNITYRNVSTYPGSTGGPVVITHYNVVFGLFGFRWYTGNLDLLWSTYEFESKWSIGSLTQGI